MRFAYEYDALHFFWGLKFDANTVVDAFRSFYMRRLKAVSDGSPRTNPDHRNHCTYSEWMGFDDKGGAAPHAACLKETSM
jgi:hypothetical protein